MEKIIAKKDKTIIKNKREAFKVKLTFGELAEIHNKNYWKTPDVQIQLGEDRINGICKTWKSMPQFILTERPLTIVMLKDLDNIEYWLIDGQHKFNSAIKLYNDDNMNECLDCVFIECDSIEKTNMLFDIINTDSEKVKNYIQSDFFVKKMITELKNKIKEKYDGCYRKKLSKSSDIMTVDEFVSELLEHNVFDGWDNGLPSSKRFIELFEEHNKKFFKEVSYLENINRTDAGLLFSDDEINIIGEYKNCLFLRNNNFREYFAEQICNGNIKSIHEYKNIRQPIPKNIKDSVWKKSYKSKKIGKCPIFNCNNQIEKEHFHCGHIISVCNGGTNDIENLRPICADCNSKMSSDNWNDYERNIIIKFYKKKCCECKKKQDENNILIRGEKLYCKECFNKNDSDSDE